MEISSRTVDDYSTNATGKAPARSPGGSALNITLVTSNANTAISADLAAGGGISITVTDEMASWKAKAVTQDSTAPDLNSPALVKQLTQPVYKALYTKLANKIGIPENMRYGNGTKEADYSNE